MNNRKTYYPSKEAMIAACGNCDYAYLSCPTHEEIHSGGKVIVMNVDGGLEGEEHPGMTYFFTVGLYVRDEDCKDGIYIPMEEYDRLVDAISDD